MGLQHSDWYEEYLRKVKIMQERQKKQEEELLTVIGQNGENLTDEIRKKYFHNYGCRNSWGEETYDEFNLGCLVHRLDAKLHPENHEWLKCWDANPMRGFHHDKCKCGFEHSCDSSD